MSFTSEELKRLINLRSTPPTSTLNTPQMQKALARDKINRAVQNARGREVANMYRAAATPSFAANLMRATPAGFLANLALPSSMGDSTTMPKNQPSLEAQQRLNQRALEARSRDLDNLRQLQLVNDLYR